MLDGWVGPTCEVPTEQFCLNQCSGQGECRAGFCLCAEGFYGHDCARRIASARPPRGEALLLCISGGQISAKGRWWIRREEKWKNEKNVLERSVEC